ncbi:MAG: hypothetical protein K8F91_05495, partial [Candidatus Obscuribacterales bacterium]|nr:hypothetical protein [Candidatus Obscuribacterales bacterium]
MRENQLAEALHHSFLNSPNYARLLARTARGAKAELNMAGLTDSAKSLVLTCLQHEIKRPLFLIVQDNHTAAHYHQELNYLSRYKVLLYPASEVSPYEQVLSSPDNVASQMEVLQRLLAQPEEPYVVVVAARSLMQRVLPSPILKDNMLTFKVGDSINPEQLARQLTRLGYTRESLVTLRGEFSVRGDIIDIFPSTGLPVRIELFGEEVESIRMFNIDSQRSVEESEPAVVGPRWWVILESEDEKREALVKTLRAITDKTIASLDDTAADTLNSVMENDLTALLSGGYPESVEYYAPYIHNGPEGFASLIDYIPSHALVAFDEWDSVSQFLTSHEDKLKKALQEGLETGRLLPLPRTLHKQADEVLTSFKENQRIFISSLPVFEQEDKDAVVEFAAKPIEKFANQMNLVVDKIRQWRQEGNRVVISTEQPQRLMGILREWDCPARYVAGPGDSTII